MQPQFGGAVIPGFCCYAATEAGEIFRFRWFVGEEAGTRLRFLKQNVISKHGYRQVEVWKCHRDEGYQETDLYIAHNGDMEFWGKHLRATINAKKKLVHRLVWAAFNGPIPMGMQIDHIDGDPTNNALSNLRCVTPKQNANNPITKQRRQKAIAKLTEAEVLEIRRRWGQGDVTMRALSEEYGVSRANIEAIVYRKTWKGVEPILDPLLD